MTVSPRLTLQQFAWATAQQDAGVPRSDVLAALGMDISAWQHEQYAWLTMFAARVKENHFELSQRYSYEYMRIRGAHPPARSPVQNRPAASEPVRPAAPEQAASTSNAAPEGSSTAPAAYPAEPAPHEALALPAPPAEPRLSTYEFAMLQAELDVCPEQAERVFAKYGLSEPPQRELELELWKRKLHATGKDFAEFRSAYKSAERHFRNLLRR
jgi:hypothetical protein